MNASIVRADTAAAFLQMWSIPAVPFPVKTNIWKRMSAKVLLSLRTQRSFAAIRSANMPWSVQGGWEGSRETCDCWESGRKARCAGNSGSPLRNYPFHKQVAVQGFEVSACSATPAANTHAVNRVLCNFMIVILLIFISQFSFPTQNALEHPGR